VTDEAPLTVAEVSELTGLSVDLITRLFEREPGVILYESAQPKRGKRRYRSMRIPRRVYERVMRRHTVQ
jgi:hypothetical protein